MEYFDVVDMEGNPTGEVVERSIAHEKGIRHRTAHIWIVRPDEQDEDNYEALLQKRAKNKDSFPGRFDTSSAGHIQAGDEPLQSALRELKEELGIEATEKDLKFVGTFPIRYEMEFHEKLFKDSEIAFVYLYKKPVEKKNLVLQKDEVEAVEWFELENLYVECMKHNQKFCVPIAGLRLIRDYLDL